MTATTAAVALADTLLAGAIQYLLQKQKVDALIETARLEQREVSPEELAALKAERDAVTADVLALLSAAEQNV